MTLKCLYHAKWLISFNRTTEHYFCNFIYNLKISMQVEKYAAHKKVYIPTKSQITRLGKYYLLIIVIWWCREEINYQNTGQLLCNI